jgi:hypothetical protein
MRSIESGAVSLTFACGGFIIVECAGEGPRPVEEMTRVHALIGSTDQDGNAQAASVYATLAAARGAADEAKRAASDVVQSNATLRSESDRAV